MEEVSLGKEEEALKLALGVLTLGWKKGTGTDKEKEMRGDLGAVSPNWEENF